MKIYNVDTEKQHRKNQTPEIASATFTQDSKTCVYKSIIPLRKLQVQMTQLVMNDYTTFKEKIPILHKLKNDTSQLSLWCYQYHTKTPTPIKQNLYKNNSQKHKWEIFLKYQLVCMMLCAYMPSIQEVNKIGKSMPDWAMYQDPETKQITHWAWWDTL